MYRKLSKKQNIDPYGDDYSVALVEIEGQSGVGVLIESARPGASSQSMIDPRHQGILSEASAAPPAISLEGPVMSSQNDNGAPSDAAHFFNGEFFENISIASTVNLARYAGAFLRGKSLSRAKRKQALDDGVVTISVFSLSEVLL